MEKSMYLEPEKRYNFRVVKVCLHGKQTTENFVQK